MDEVMVTLESIASAAVLDTPRAASAARAV
jgi:hypothetical protein